MKLFLPLIFAVILSIFSTPAMARVVVIPQGDVNRSALVFENHSEKPVSCIVVVNFGNSTQWRQFFIDGYSRFHVTMTGRYKYEYACSQVQNPI